MNDGRVIFDVAGAADYLGCSENTTRKHLKSGAIRARKEDGRWFIHRDALDEFVKGPRLRVVAGRAS